jgi:hypothetical protein
MGYGSRNAWPPQKKTPAWSSGWQSGKLAGKEHPWKCVGTNGCGYSWNKPQHRFCNQCNLHWDFGQRLGVGKDAPGTPATAAGATPGTSPVPPEGAPDPDASATRLASIAKLRAELDSITAVLASDHAEVTTRQGKLDALEEEQRASLPVVPGNTQLTRVLAKIRANKTFQTKSAKTLAYTETRLAAAKKAHEEAIEWQKQIDKELLELEIEQSKLCATLAATPGESEKPDLFEMDSNDGWEDMFDEGTDEDDQNFSGDVQDQYHRFRKARAALQKVCRDVKALRASRSSNSSPSERKPDTDMEAEGEGATTGPKDVKTSARPPSTDVGGDASRRRVT